MPKGGQAMTTWILSTPLTRSRVWQEARKDRICLIDAIIEEAEAQRELRKESMRQIPAREDKVFKPSGQET